MLTFDKVFVIGFNKTGTCTLHHLFTNNSLPSQHSVTWHTDDYTCFSDGGDSNHHETLHKLYPNAIFIMNVRDLHSWLFSRYKHGIRLYTKNKIPSNWAYPPTVSQTITWIHEREAYHLRILRFFADKPHKLIIVSIHSPKWLNFVANNLSLHNVDEFSHRNKCTYDSENALHKHALHVIDRAFSILHYSYEEKHNLLIKDDELQCTFLELYNNNINNH